ncbi:DUF1189 domain-containing protein [Azotosporobacter soli]|uniref:DUF1189 domain-containing protein n=1 Tax=Azotosporobacter soli TaxID=3055040 RepID=UPI0031FF4225
MLQQLIGSLFRIEFYKLALQEPLRKAVHYFLLLSLVLGTLMGFKVIFWVTSGVNEVVETFNDSFPEFVVAEGKLKVEGKMPYVVFRQDEDTIVIVDTTGQTGEAALQGYKSGVLFTENAMINKKGEGDMRTTNFSHLQEATLTKSDVAHWLPALKWLSLIALFMGLVYYFLAQILSATIVTLLTFWLARSMKRRLTYSEAARLSLYALTASCILDMVKFIGDFSLPGYGILYYGMPMLYVIRTLKNSEK